MAVFGGEAASHFLTEPSSMRDSVLQFASPLGLSHLPVQDVCREADAAPLYPFVYVSMGVDRCSDFSPVPSG